MSHVIILRGEVEENQNLKLTHHIITSPTHTSTLSLNSKLNGVNKSTVEATSW